MLLHTGLLVDLDGGLVSVNTNDLSDQLIVTNTNLFQEKKTGAIEAWGVSKPSLCSADPGGYPISYSFW